MKKTKRYLVPFALWIGLSLAFVNLNPVQADGNNSLNQSARFYLQGGVVTSGVGLRGTGTGDITISGLPIGSEVYQAFLYWSTLGSVNTYNSPTLNNIPINGELIGTSGDTCWDVQHNYVYRANVSTLIKGNGTYTIEGLPNSLLKGNDSQGAYLIVVYSHEAEPFRTVLINDGAVSLDFLTNVYTDTLTGYTPDNPVSEAEITYLVGDGQSIWDSGRVTYTESTIGSNVFNGTDGDHWDTLTFDVTTLTTDAPALTSIDNNDPTSRRSPDCLLWAATILSVTSPAPNSEVNELTPFYSDVTYGDVTASGVGLRGTGEGEIVVTGIPAGMSVNRAYLYWATIGTNNDYTNPLLNGNLVDGSVIGTSADTCWGVPNNFVYRADVTDIVDGNGTYKIDGLPNSFVFSGNESQGASLVIIYHGPALHNVRRQVVINDGAVTLNYDVNVYTDLITGYHTDTPLSEARITYLIGDGQSIWDNGDVIFNGTFIAKNVFTGVDGEHWGTLSFDVTNLVDGSPASTTIDNERTNDDSLDCLLWSATVFSVTTPQPDFNFSFYLPLVER